MSRPLYACALNLVKVTVDSRVWQALYSFPDSKRNAHAAGRTSYVTDWSPCRLAMMGRLWSPGNTLQCLFTNLSTAHARTVTCDRNRNVV
nr:bursicon-B [Urechis unicinctus]